MYHPCLKEFLRLTRKGNVIPIYKEINGDLETPVSSFLRLKKDDYAFLLESVEGQEKIARYSFLGTKPSLVFKSKGRNIELIYSNGKPGGLRFRTTLTPLDEIRKIMQNFKGVSVKGLPRFYGGFVGFMGYDMVRFFERIPDRNPDDLGIEDALFMLTDNLLVFDHLNHRIKIVSNVILPQEKRVLTEKRARRLYHNAIKRIESIQEDFNTPIREDKNAIKHQPSEKRIVSNLKTQRFKDIVTRAKDYIRKGDIIQVVLSQRFKLKADKDPFAIYRNLRSLNPSPYMYFLKLKNLFLIGSSPEMLVRCEEGVIQTRPIAGTRPRGKNEREDKKLERELIRDKKEKAEHLMLVDLGRNDIGRVSKTGTVKISEFMRIEKYSHVMHLVSEVKGQLDNKRYDIFELLKAVFPAGTVSGSPKIRAMEIIDELENLKRGPYAGCVGYFSFSQNMDTCITIRTIVIKGGSAYIQAGAGIVADSVPEKEYHESVNKAKALVEAIVK